MKKRSELFFSFLLVPIDFMMMIAGFALAYIVRVKIESKPVAHFTSGTHFLALIAILLPIWIIIFALNGLYNLSSTRRRFTEAAKVLVATASGVMVLIILDFFSKDPIFPSKSIPIYGFLFSFILILVARSILRSIQRYLFRYNIGVHNVLIIGNNKQSEELINLLSDKKSGYNVVNNTIKAISNWDITEIQHINKDHNLDDIIQVDQTLSDSNLIEIIAFSDQHHIAYKFVPSLAGIYKTNITTSTIQKIPIVELVQTPLEGWGRIVKRICDLFISAIGLIILSPLFLLITIIIKIIDPGPAFYRHRRIGKAGKEIDIVKFRTMYLKYSDGGKYSGKSAETILKELGNEELLDEFKKEYKLKNDIRVHPFGKFLRRTSLDELPQLINVFNGDLSLVGPRPIIESELSKYGKRSAQLLAIKPGITGLWQVSGRNDISYEERIKLELYYVEHWSIVLDIIILIKTGLLIIKGSNGY
ncbi:MAG TPA: sugar transferase [Gammaproteobacteria bacterium]|nr:sugar transferase [Gammaproteobacteria bacterium]